MHVNTNCKKNPEESIQPQTLTILRNYIQPILTIAKPRFLSLFRRECLHWLQVEVVVQMQIVEVLAVDQQVEHVVALPADLQAGLNPVQGCSLEELCRLE